MLKEYRTLLPYLKRYLPRYVPGILFLVLVDGLQLLIPRQVKNAVDLIASGSFTEGGIALIALRIALLALFIALGRFTWRLLIFSSARRIEAELRQRLFDRLLFLDGSFYQANKTGDLMARATNDLNRVRQACGMGFVTLVDGIFMSLAILFIMFSTNARIAGLAIIPLPAITFLIVSFGGFVGRKAQAVQERFSRLSDIAQESLSGIRIVQSFAREGWFSARFSTANDEYREANMVLARLFGFLFPLVAFLSGVATLILIVAGGMASLSNQFSPGDIVSMLAYLEMLIWPLLGAGFLVDTFQRGGASLKRVNEILSAESPIRDGPGAVRGLPRGTLRIRGLSYAHPLAAEPALKDISFEVEGGTTLGILGRTGSGKSTLLRLLPRLADPPPGTIFLDGIDIRERSIRDLRSAFGFVPQETFLFSATIRENIAFGKEGLDEERMRRVASIAALDADLSTFPAGLDTLVGERGLSLSGGQKQRVAIARALAADPEILIFDDALSAVDTATEERILQALIQERRGRTNIIVSHRVSTLQHADQVIVLEGGRVVQRGSPRELLARDGLYADLSALQSLDDEEAP